MPGMPDALDPLVAERRLGAAEGEAFDGRLREAEESERAERLRGPALPGTAAGEGEAATAEAPPEGRASLPALQLEAENRRLRDYYVAVQNSRAWRLTQQLRRLAGRRTW